MIDALILGLGVTAFNKPPDGLWYQERHPFTLHLTSPALQVGVRKGNWVMQIDYLGQVKTFCECDPIDENYGAGKEPVFGLTTFRGSGSLTSLSLNYRFEKNWWYIQPGVQLLRANWKVDVENWYAPTDPARHSFTVKNHKFGVSPRLGLGLNLSHNLSVDVGITFRPQQSGPYHPPWKRPTVTAMLTWSIK